MMTAVRAGRAASIFKIVHVESPEESLHIANVLTELVSRLR